MLGEPFKKPQNQHFAMFNRKFLEDSAEHVSRCDRVGGSGNAERVDSGCVAKTFVPSSLSYRWVDNATGGYPPSDPVHPITHRLVLLRRGELLPNFEQRLVLCVIEARVVPRHSSGLDRRDDPRRAPFDQGHDGFFVLPPRQLDQAGNIRSWCLWCDCSSQHVP